MSTYRVESLLSARLFLSPQIAGSYVYFLSDQSGRLSLYRMLRSGSVPEPLLPRDIGLMTPTLIGGSSFHAFPGLEKVLVMIDKDGDENYQPHWVPLTGGFPEPVFGSRFAGKQLVLEKADEVRNLAVFNVDLRTSPEHESYLVDLETGETSFLGSSVYGNSPVGATDDFSRIVLGDSYTSGDHVLYLWERGNGDRRLLFGQPLESRAPGEKVRLNAISDCEFTPQGGLLFTTALFDDHYGIGYFKLDNPEHPEAVTVLGCTHTGEGELEHLQHIKDSTYLVGYNIDGASWAYEAAFDEQELRLDVSRVLVGEGVLANGVAQSIRYAKDSDSYAIAFSTSTTPVQIFVAERSGELRRLTEERVLGVQQEWLSEGVECSYLSHDGLRISARLYRPAAALGYSGPRPVVFYIHGGPQGQERPDFTWFSMPLIQFLTLNGFAVFVPNVRGSHGYGLEFMKRVDRDWGGEDRLDHVAAVQHLRAESDLDMTRVAVMGRSYGGYMTLTLVGRHPELWKAACDMFGPYNLLTFLDRIPATWKPYFHLALGHPEQDRDFLVERSPDTYLGDLACPMLVIQGRNDPRVVAAESEDLVKALRNQGKQIEFLLFENEGHDVTKFENKVRCYTEIVRFFKEHLGA
jgi:pimeloyl-ACP methyl ester carboxylesterase